MSRHNDQRLIDILAAAAAVADHITWGELDDGLVFDAVRVRLIEVGEAVKAIDRRRWWLRSNGSLRTLPLIHGCDHRLGVGLHGRREIFLAPICGTHYHGGHRDAELSWLALTEDTAQAQQPTRG